LAGFFVTNYLAIGRLVPAYSEVGGPWYQYEGSYWSTDPNKIKRGIDFAGDKESRVDYALHFLVGHHGVFALTPVFLFSLAGMLSLGSPTPQEEDPQGRSVRRILAALALLLSIVVIGFYLYKTTNYGGRTSGPRWLMWLTPFWLITMLPILDWLSTRRWGRWLAYILLALSVFSVSYPAWNPWRHPWLYILMESQGWIEY
jgi:hypothetical protein